MRENEEQTYTCSECGAVVDEGNLHTFDEHVLCDECLERLTVTYFAFHRKASLITINSTLSTIQATSIVSVLYLNNKYPEFSCYTVMYSL